MQPLNDHMEDMIRRAAQDYPLDTRGADWEKVQKKLSGEDKRRRGAAWLLLLLIPLGVVGFLYINSPADQRLPDKLVVDHKPVAPARTNDISNNDIITPIENTTRTPAVADKKQEASRGSGPGNRSTNNPSPAFSAHSPSRSVSVVDQNFSDGTSFNDPSMNTPAQAAAHSLDKLKLSALPLMHQPRAFDLSQPGAALARMDLKFNSVPRIKKFYVGVVGAVDATTIRFQKVDRTGNRAGFIAGYAFSKNFSVETGLFSTTKYYYTNGEYFDKSKLGIPANWVIQNVDGNCRMIEIPVALRYNFSPAPEGNWFATAGVRSYVMQQENYEYQALYASGTVGSHYYSYKEGSRRLAADITLSGGYQWTLGGFADVRVEPFVQLPVRGMGVGNLKFTSAGLQVGLTHKMF